MSKKNRKMKWKDLPDKLLNLFIDGIKKSWKKSKTLTILMIIILGFGCFFCGKNGLLGENIAKFINNVWGTKDEKSNQTIKIDIENVDTTEIPINNSVGSTKENNEKGQTVKKSINECNTPQKRIVIDFNFLVRDRQGILNNTYYSGDEITFSYKTDCDSYILLISLNKTGFLDLLDNSFVSQYVNINSEETISFQLDSIVGYEVFYLFASHNLIEFDKDIKSELLKIQTTHSKGVDMSYNLNMSNKDIYYKRIYFNHQ